MTAAGFAVVWRGELQVQTVAATERAAKVNGLLTLFGVVILNHHSDAHIADAWTQLANRHAPALSVAPVKIEVTA